MSVQIYWYRHVREEEPCNECDTPTDMRAKFEVIGQDPKIIPLCQPCYREGIYNVNVYLNVR